MSAQQPQPHSQPRPPHHSIAQAYYTRPMPQPENQTNPNAAPPTENIIYSTPVLVQQAHSAVDDSNRTCFFFLGLILALILGAFAFLFFACADSVGIVGKRKLPFLIGNIIGFLISTAVVVIALWLFLWHPYTI